jgi:hypothetical protein
VDLDPLAVELCRLALWIETMDRDLPFSFLDHKIKCGNSLVGSWFDTFQHYPVMAWKNREGGDKGHTNGVHFEKEARTKAIKAFVRDSLTPDLQALLRGRTLFHEDLQERAAKAHAGALAVLSRLHDMPVHAASDRARVYRDEVVGSAEYQALARAMNLWCACWFWPLRDMAHAPLPTTLATPPLETLEAADRLWARKRFFQWELEFSDVFYAGRSGFDAILGNPPWDIAKPNSKEFFSNIDPLYRGYGKQEAVERQTNYFADPDVEEQWLDYNADFRAQSNMMGYAAFAFGDPLLVEKPEDRFTIVKGRRKNSEAHQHWRAARAQGRGFADPAHSYRHQGSADLSLYKLFLERAYSLLRAGGRLGFIVPASLYADHGTGDLRRLFLGSCRWEWLFGFENRDKIFDIHRSFKFNPVIIEKGGETRAIRAAFMRSKLEDWDQADAFVTPYTRDQVERFSPKSKAILEIETGDDLGILERAHASSVTIGRQESSGWHVRYSREFHLSDDSKLFPPLPDWVERGFIADRYGRFLDPSGHHALPLYEGRLVDQYDFFAKNWVKGKGRAAEWQENPWVGRVFHPQYLMDAEFYRSSGKRFGNPKAALMEVSSATNTRTLIVALVPDWPGGNKTPFINAGPDHVERTAALVGILNSFAADFVARRLVVGLTVGWYVLEALPLPELSAEETTLIASQVLSLNAAHEAMANAWVATATGSGSGWRRSWAVTESERIRRRCMLDAISFAAYGLNGSDATHVLGQCDLPQSAFTSGESPRLTRKGFWRVDKDKDPELRHTVLTLVAFADLAEKIRGFAEREKGIEAFLKQNDGEGWMLPETLRLADYGLGHDERAKHPQPVASRLGPRFYDWQLAQTTEESWRECEIHAQNLQATGLLSSQAALPADTVVVNKANLRPRTKRWRHGEKGLFALDGREDEPA